jgi:signal transduction histidine kinase
LGPLPDFGRSAELRPWIQMSDPATEPSAPTAAHPTLLLLVDVTSGGSEAIAEALAGAGYRLVIATHSRMVVDLSVRERVDLLLIEQSMLECAGRELIQGLDARRGGLPVIVYGCMAVGPARRELIRTFGLQGAHAHDGSLDGLLELIEAALAVAQRRGRQHESDEVRGLILAKLCHELRASLNVIGGYADIMLNDPATVAFRPILGRLNAASEAAQTLMRDYLDLACIDAAAVTVDRACVDIDRLIEELRAFAARQIQQRPIRFSASVPVRRTAIFTDGPKLQAILRQLLANAIKFTPAGTVRLLVDFTPNEICFAITDSGPGVNDIDAQTLFGAFRQVRHDKLAPIPGRGLGLAMAWRLSALIGASVSVDREDERGRTFTLRLPTAVMSRRAAKAQPTLH